MKLELEIDTDGLENLKRIMRASGVPGEQEFFETAVALLNWAVEQRIAGRKIASIDRREKAYRELEIPLLQGMQEDSQMQRSGFQLKGLLWGTAIGIFLMGILSLAETEHGRTLDENLYSRNWKDREAVGNRG